jgi:hypothetical protein
MSPQENMALVAVEKALRNYPATCDLTVESDLDFEDTMAWVAGSQAPGDVIRLLCGLKWSLMNEECHDWIVSLNQILMLLDQREEGEWQTERLAGLSSDDCAAILAWLRVAQSWPGVAEYNDDLVEELIAAWRARCESNGA